MNCLFRALSYAKKSCRKGLPNSRAKNLSLGFTMIELLCVLVIIGSLGTSAFGQLVDFRNEAKAAVVRSALTTIRVGFKNQRQQAALKCGWVESEYCSYGKVLSALMNNDMTAAYQGSSSISLDNRAPRPGCTFGTPSPVCPINTVCPPPDPVYLCTADQIPNEADRRFMTSGAGARVATGQRNSMPDNPFITDSQATTAVVLRTSARTLAFPTGCDLAERARAAGQHTHWIYLSDTDEIIPGTNTPGINECNF